MTVFCLRKRICSSSKFQRLRELKWIQDDLSLEPRVLVQTGQHGESSLGGRERREKAGNMIYWFIHLGLKGSDEVSFKIYDFT